VGVVQFHFPLPDSLTDDLTFALTLDGVATAPPPPPPPLRSPEAQKVIDRMTNLTPQEEDAIADFVDLQVTRGIWSDFIDFWHFGLSDQQDRRTGWVAAGPVTIQGPFTYLGNIGVYLGATTFIDTTYSGVDIYVGQECTIGAVCSTSYTGTGNWDPWGARGADDHYMRWRGTDTVDVQTVLSNVTGGRINGVLDLSNLEMAAASRNATQKTTRVNGVEVTVADTFGTNVNTSTIHINGTNNGGSTNPRDSRYSAFFIIGKKVNMQVLEFDIQLLTNDLA
jgi:hypothetical protein